MFTPSPRTTVDPGPPSLPIFSAITLVSASGTSSVMLPFSSVLARPVSTRLFLSCSISASVLNLKAFVKPSCFFIAACPSCSAIVTFEKDDRIYAVVERKFTKAKDLIKSVIAEEYIKEKVKSIK